ncbi:two-component system sensor histidine kinase YesM [Hydrogenispora ethanolica]|uniref:Two-component system sensor histidine kinase YesM n=1 Tax=Hydrogenispora ethanolica TaxID=1082276 RepID=A0A4R1S4T0_HYDET|nr:two-component system sensor histidine kinase YesM [Hydrogenispora ethanolica]
MRPIQELLRQLRLNISDMINYLTRNYENHKAFINLAGFIRQTGIQNRLFISFAILSLIPLLITGVFAYYKSSEAIKTKISTYSIQVVNQVSENIQNALARFESDSVDIAFSDIFQKTLISYATLNDWQKTDAELKMQAILAKRFLFFRSVSDVLVYTQNKEKIIAYGDMLFKLKLKSDFLEDIFQETAARKGVPVWLIEDQANEAEPSNSIYRMERYGSAGILLARSFKSLEQGIPIGYIIIRINEKYILNKYKSINLGNGADTFILNRQGVVISSRNPDTKVARLYPDPSFSEALKSHMKEGKYTFNHIISGKRCLIAYTYIPGADWFVVSAIPFFYLNSESTRIGIYIAILGIICFLLALFLSFIVTKSIAKPLHQLVDSMKNVETGNFVVRIEDRSKDEIGEVTNVFNKMVREIKDLIEEVKNKEKLKRIAELKTLQAQINPHFLANTLNTVRWLANIQKADNISSVVTSLMQLLDGCMGKGRELVEFRDEITYVKNYLNIMAYRYYDKFKVHYQIEAEILDCQVPKFILQPIVENSLIHGLGPGGGQGIIVVKGYRAGNDLKMIVRDNGVGIPGDVMDNLLQEKPPEKKDRLSGIGIWNIEERIKLNFGPEYGITIESVPNLYTTVEITIPVIEKEGAELDAKGVDCG